MKTNILIIITLLFCLTAIFSCKKYVDVGQPKNQITSQEVFADSADARATLLGIYITAMNSSLALSSGGLTVYPGLSSDELNLSGSVPVNVQFYANNILPTNNTNNGFWVAGYSYIYAANACIDGVSQSSGISATAKSQIIAEARFIRAFIYFNLVNLYGAVPLVTTSDYKISGVAGRSATDQVYDSIITDLQFAEANLGENTGTNDRPNSLTASALLAKVYLYNGKYAMAKPETDKVINSGLFALESDLALVFTSSSTEIIWQLELPFNKFNWEGQSFVPGSSSALPNYIITPGLYASFEPGDQRVVQWINVNTVNSQNFPYPFKYKNNAANTNVNENYVVLRLADQYLIRAESEANLGDITGAVADINLIRSRAALTPIAATDKSSAMSAIVNERRHELFCEWGNRWFDLKRWNLANSVLGSKPNWNTNVQLYPIPITQINSNPNLSQNPGY